MGLLSPEAVESLGAVLDGRSPASGAEGAEIEVPETPPTQQEEEVHVTDNSSESAHDVNLSAKEEAPEAATTEEVEVEVGEGHRVPYSRFRQVLDARNKHRDELEALREKVSEIDKEREMLQRLTIQRATEPHVQQRADDDWMGDLLGDEAGAGSSSDTRLAELTSRLEAQEMAFQKMKLEAEVVEAIEKYPNAERGAILDAIYNNPSVTAMGAAEQYSTWLSGVEEAAIARHLADSGQDPTTSAAPPPVAAPRPSKTGADAIVEFTGDRKPKTVKEGSEMFREFLKEHNPFT